MLPASRALLRYWRSVELAQCPASCRQFSRTPTSLSGHSKWATIKHDKAKGDAVKAKQRSTASSDIVDASRTLGPDPAHNTRLANAINFAKRAGLSKTAIEAAVARGQGRSVSGAPLESLTIEAVVPPVAIIVDCQTDNKAKTLQDLRLALKERGGTQTPTAYLFERRGRITLGAKDGIGVDEILEVALEAGAIDVAEGTEGTIVVDTDAVTTAPAAQRISERTGLEVKGFDTIWWPNQETMVESIDERVLEELSKLHDELREYPGVQAVYTNLDQKSR